MKTAKEISEYLLEKTAAALLAGDFEAFTPYFRLPHFIATSEQKTVLNTVEDMRAVFNRVVQDYTRKQITDLVRVCDVAEYRTKTRIEATHTTHMMSGNQRVGDPFPSFSVLELVDGRWVVTSSQYAVDKTTTVGRALSTTTVQQPK